MGVRERERERERDACNGMAMVRHDGTQNILMTDFQCYGLSAAPRPTSHRFEHNPDLEENSTIQPG